MNLQNENGFRYGGWAFDPPSTSESEERQNLSFAVQKRRLQTSENPGGLKYRNGEPLHNDDWLTSEL